LLSLFMRSCSTAAIADSSSSGDVPDLGSSDGLIWAAHLDDSCTAGGGADGESASTGDVGASSSLATASTSAEEGGRTRATRVGRARRRSRHRVV
jgi:hypothetical protein